MSSQFRVEGLSVLNNRSTSNHRLVDGIIVVSGMHCRWYLNEPIGAVDPDEVEGHLAFTLSVPKIVQGLERFCEAQVRTFLEGTR